MANVDIDILNKICDIVGHKYEGVYEINNSKDAIIEEKTVECILDDLLDIISVQKEEIKELSKTDEERYDDYLWKQADNYNDEAKMGLR